MRDVNKVILVGRLGSDPVRRETKKGQTVVNFPVATSRKLGPSAEQDGEELREETQWHRVVTWGRQAETCAEFLRKGNPVYVEGMIRSKPYVAKDGSDRVSFEVHADRVNFLGGRRSEGDPADAEVPALATG